jgi:hypothetical protein
MKKTAIILLSVLFFIGCKKDKNNADEALVKTDTIKLINYFYEDPALVKENTYNKSFVNLYEKVTYEAAKILGTSTLPEKIDFGYAYIQDYPNSWLRVLANPDYLATTSTALNMKGLSNWSVKTKSMINSTSLPVSDFDKINTVVDLSKRFEEQKDSGTEGGKKVNLNSSYSTDELKQPPVFLFIDHAGRKGFIRVLPYVAKINYKNDSNCFITIVVKMIK